MVTAPVDRAEFHPSFKHHQPSGADVMMGINYNVAGAAPSDGLMVAPPDLPVLLGPGQQPVLSLVANNQVVLGYGGPVPYVPEMVVPVGGAVLPPEVGIIMGAELPRMSVAEEFKAKVLGTMAAPLAAVPVAMAMPPSEHCVLSSDVEGKPPTSPSVMEGKTTSTSPPVMEGKTSTSPVMEGKTSTSPSVMEGKTSTSPVMGKDAKPAELAEEGCKATPTDALALKMGEEVAVNKQEEEKEEEAVVGEEKRDEVAFRTGDDSVVPIEEAKMEGDEDDVEKENEKSLSPNELSDGSEREEGEIDDFEEEPGACKLCVCVCMCVW